MAPGDADGRATIDLNHTTGRRKATFFGRNSAACVLHRSKTHAFGRPAGGFEPRIRAIVAAVTAELDDGSHIFPRLFDHEYPYIFQNPDRRITFAIPYEHDFTLLGTTDLEYHGDPAQVAIDDESSDPSSVRKRSTVSRPCSVSPRPPGPAACRCRAATCRGRISSASRHRSRSPTPGCTRRCGAELAPGLYPA